MLDIGNPLNSLFNGIGELEPARRFHVSDFNSPTGVYKVTCFRGENTL